MSNVCNTSQDCLDNPENNGVVKQCYEEAAFSEETNFCDCSNWYGWKGQNCDEYTGQVLFYSISQLAYIILSIFIIITVVRVVYIYVLYGSEEQTKTDPIVFTALFIFGGAFFLLVHATIVISGLIDPSRFELNVYDEYFGEVEDINVIHGKAATHCLFLASSFFFLAALQVFHTWHQVIVKASHFSGNKQVLLAKRTHIAIKVFIIAYVLLAMITVIADERTLSVLLVSAFGMLLGIAYPVAYWRMVRAFKGFKVNDHDFISKTIELIRFCCFVNSVCLVGSAIVLFVVYLLFYNVNERFAPGEFNYVLFLRELTGFAGVLMLAVKSWYVNTMLARCPMPKSRVLSVLWDKWDSKHEEVYQTRSRVTASQLETLQL